MTLDQPTTTTGILLFDDAEELDYVGPWEVFTMARMLAPGDTVVTIAASVAPIVSAKGMRVLPDRTLETAPPLDVLLIPGGTGTRALAKDPIILDWVRRRAAECTWVSSVCTGALVLAAAGLLANRRATTHWVALDELRLHDDVEVLEGVRYVRDGSVVTAAGVSAGIDMALWLVGQLKDAPFARNVQRMMQYDPAPPYQAEV
jgi:transcriptional regulator GlxA family with amidase domain